MTRTPGTPGLPRTPKTPGPFVQLGQLVIESGGWLADVQVFVGERLLSARYVHPDNHLQPGLRVYPELPPDVIDAVAELLAPGLIPKVIEADSY